MRPSWCFPLAECSQKQMDYGRRFKMRNRSLSLIVVLVTVSIVTYRPVLAQGPATVEPMHVHHVHLNSLNPKAAAEYYLKPFPASTTKTTFNGYEAVKTGNVYLLFTKVNTPPQTASSSTCRAIHYPDCQRRSRSSKCEPRVRSRRGREALDISGARTAR